MIKTVSFELFGNKEDYLTLNINDLMTIESITGLSIIEIFRNFTHGVYTLTSIYQILPVAYNECAKDKEEKQTVANLIDSALENGASITDFGLPIMKAILETGIFGKSRNRKKLLKRRIQNKRIRQSKTVFCDRMV